MHPISPDLGAVLHVSLVPILRHVLSLAPLPRTGLVLDLACGAGRKLPLLAEACGPGVRLVGIDHDRSMIRAAQAAYSGAGHWLIGDALAVPLRGGCCAAVFCIAALGLFADRRAALREMRRVLRPGGLALLATGTQAWAPLVRWPAALATRLRAAYARALAEGCMPLAATPDLDSELAKWLEEAGFAAPHIRAFLLDAATHPLEAELPLLPWAGLRPLLAAQLAPEDLAACDRLAAGADAELCAIALIAQARSPC